MDNTNEVSPNMNLEKKYSKEQAKEFAALILGVYKNDQTDVSSDGVKII